MRPPEAARWNYAAFSLVAAHSIAYQVNEK